MTTTTVLERETEKKMAGSFFYLLRSLGRLVFSLPAFPSYNLFFLSLSLLFKCRACSKWCTTPTMYSGGKTSGVCVIIMIITREVDGWPFGHKGRPLKGRRKKNKHKRCLLGHSTALVRFSLSSAPDSTT